MGFSPDIVAGTDARLYDVWIQFWKACRDINTASLGATETGSRTWPEGTWVYAQGKIRSATQIAGGVELVCEDNAGALFTWNTVGGVGFDDWYNYGGPVVWRPDFYDLLIET